MSDTLQSRYKRYLVTLKILGLSNNFEVVIVDSDIVLKSFKFGERLKHLAIPSGITALGTACFSGTAVESVVLCNSIEAIGYGCFANCNVLKQIYIHPQHLPFKSILQNSNRADVIVIKNVM